MEIIRLGIEEASSCFSQHCKNHFSRMREASTVLIKWVCKVFGGLLCLKHTHKTQDRGNHIITHMSLWFGKTSGWLPAAARNDGEPDRARLSHTPYAFSQHFPPHTFLKCSKHAVQICQENELHRCALAQLSNPSLPTY